jgi:periplasmic protein TonB
MAYSERQVSSNRVTAIVGVGAIHALLGYALVTGLAGQAFDQVARRIEAINIAVQPLPQPPPPPVDEVQPQVDTATPLPNAPTPPIDLGLTRPSPEVTDIILPPIPPDALANALADAVAGPVTLPSPPPSRARGLSPDNQGRWARQIQENYPGRAIRAGTEGRVGVTVQVGASGRVTGCTVASSSGSSVLDEAACDGMQRFARFNPALNDAGSAVGGTYSTVIVYRLR